ncbi:related to A.thaliana hyp1 protein [Rhynchosporium agropyri]|uniref:Related to A.thaliana hyp1 protein n=1 Tax=Rhynchosporium agropyri TaxID=914238 RepID=A0A1E1L8C1_9HELO|nr:related to A.thaliana hyp1 protein [Rhynchosporium agropyri]
MAHQSSGGAGSANGSDKNSSSLSAFLSTLIPVGALALLFVGIFLILRTKQKRVYRPRTYLETLYEGEKSKDPPPGTFSWIAPFRGLDDEYVLNHQSLDGYLYMRFIKMLMVICFIGSCITMPVLFPVNATAGGPGQEFDLLSFSNIPENQHNRYYAHVFVAWIFFSFVMYVITRETIYFINIRHSYLLSPFNAARISSRTVLFTDVPVEYQNQDRLSALFGGALRRSWLAPDCKDLTDKVEERDKDALKLETAEIKLSQIANKRRLKWVKKNGSRKDAATRADGADAEVALPGSQFMKEKDRPTHKLGKIPLIGKKVDTIEWSRSELRRLIPEVEKEQALKQRFDGKLLPAVFVEFQTQQAAEAAYRRMTPRKDPKLNPRAISATPKEIIWSNLKISKTQRKLRKIATTTFIVLMIIFWAIPVAVVGAISNINYLTDKLPWLSFINSIPDPILGVVTGLLPSVMLAVLMALVPIICRLMAKLSGEVTRPAVELKCQTWYMAFQVIQVFLVMTFASGAASVVTNIINDPSSATTLLAESLPKASNFFISYIIVLGLGIAAGDLLNIGALAMLTIVGKFLDKSPRKIFNRYITLAGLGWGSLYPKFGNMGVIAIAYSIIQPLVMGFATVGFGLVYLAVRYNSFYVLTNNVDTKGAAYAHALQQLMVGVYLGEVCLLGLFAIAKSWPHLALMIFFLVCTAIYHSCMRHALKPLTMYLPENFESDQVSLFTTADHKSYDYKKAGVPPTEAQLGPTSKFGAMKANMFSKLWDPKKFKSHARVQSLVPNYPPPQYTAEEEALAYYDPALTSEVPRLWIVRDDMGISRREVAESRKGGLEMSDEFASFNEKNKVVWEYAKQGRIEDVPIWEKRVDY